jgi:cytochrome c oxidase subunit IV
MEQEHYVVPVRTYLTVFVVLMVLVAVTVSASFIDLGIVSVIVALGIATVKAGLIMLYFMHLRYSSKITWVFAGLGFLGLLIMILIAMGDYVARGGVIVPAFP